MESLQEKKSTGEWHKELCPNVVIMDPDGWDRTRLDESFAEKITKEEYLRRLMVSTVCIIDSIK